MRTRLNLIAIAGVLGSVFHSASSPANHRAAQREVGRLEVAWNDAPGAAACLRITVSDEHNDARDFALTPGQRPMFQLAGLSPGNASVSADAFQVGCSALTMGVEPVWFSEPIAIKIRAGGTAHVVLSMIHAPGASSRKPYLVPSDPNVAIKAILTSGDALPDGVAALDDGHGTFTLLSSHALAAVVSKWTIRTADLAVLHGEQLKQRVSLWNPSTSAYDAPAPDVAFAQLCAPDLPAKSALFDVESGLGWGGRLLLDGEQSGAEGRSIAHGLDGTSYVLPRLGKMRFGRVAANPNAGPTTLVAALDASPLGQVYFYVGRKLDAGTPVDRAGMTDGALYGMRVTDVAAEDPATGMATGSFRLHAFGNVESWSGARLESESDTTGITRFQQPQDGAWDPNDANDFYFVTRAGRSTPTRLWRARFTDVCCPEQGGMIEMLLDGSKGGAAGVRMFDAITIDQYGHAYLLEDGGDDDRLGKVWRYDIAADTLTEVAHAEPSLFDPTLGSPTFLTHDEQVTGIVDAAQALGPGWLLLDARHHAVASEPARTAGSQYLALYDPAAAGL